MFVNYDKCRSCGSQVELATTFSKVLPSVQYLPKDPDSSEVSHTSMSVYLCKCCGLVQTPWRMPETYYDDYIMTVGFSSQMQTYLKGLADEVIELAGTSKVKVLDVGAGDGTFMKPFKDLGCDVVGIEPSDCAVKEAKANGFNVVQGYLGADTKMTEGPFDVFVSRQVFEHIDDLSSIIAGIKKNIKYGAIGVIEVPSLEKAIKDNRFFDFFPDHVNYFSLHSLASLLIKNGFKILSLKHTMGDEYNVAVVKYNGIGIVEDLSELLDNSNLLINNFDAFLKNRNAESQTIGVWGAGAKGLTIMSRSKASNLISCVLDSDKNKQGRYTPISNIKIVDPHDGLRECDNIVILAIAYQKSILAKLKTEYNYSGRVWVLDKSNFIEVTNER